MANNTHKRNKKSRSQGRRRNPLTIGARKHRLRISFDGSTFTGNTMGPLLSGVANIIGGSIFGDCQTSNSVTSSIATLVQNYEEYRIRSCRVHWLPAVSPGVAAGGGSCYMATEFNPEKMATFSGFTATQTLAAVKQMRNHKFWNAWERFSFSPPMTTRRKWFDVNSTVTPGADVFDRSTQFMLIFGADTIGATDTIGKFEFEYLIDVRGYDEITT